MQRLPVTPLDLKERLDTLIVWKLLKARQLLLLCITWIQLLCQQINTACLESLILEKTWKVLKTSTKYLQTINKSWQVPHFIKNQMTLLKVMLILKIQFGLQTLHSTCHCERLSYALNWFSHLSLLEVQVNIIQSILVLLHLSHNELTSRHSRPLPWPPMPHKFQWRSSQHSGSALWLLVCHQIKARIKTERKACREQWTVTGYVASQP